MSEVKEIKEDLHKPIQFTQITKIDVDGPWPQFARITLGLLTAGPLNDHVRITEDGKIMFTVHSGWARYRLDVEQDSEYYLRLVLEETGK